VACRLRHLKRARWYLRATGGQADRRTPHRKPAFHLAASLWHNSTLHRKDDSMRRHVVSRTLIAALPALAATFAAARALATTR